MLTRINAILWKAHMRPNEKELSHRWWERAWQIRICLITCNAAPASHAPGDSVLYVVAKSGTPKAVANPPLCSCVSIMLPATS
jgi:hypothetical protein